ncbi:MAG: radical SAM protein [Nitrospirae bacterium]|nr:radical SAM protein [Nitrospirota bacterium]
MILVYPPVAKPSEPPAGLAKLSGALNQHGIKHRVLDANLEGLLYLTQQPQPRSDKWTDRAFRNISGNLRLLKDRHAYGNLDHYKRAVKDINHVLELSALNSSATLGLANYQHKELSPLRSSDLIRAAESPEQNPFYPYFRERISELLRDEYTSVIGFSLNYLSQALCTFAMVGFLRKEYPELTIVLGGGLVTSWMKRPDWHNPFRGLVDHLVAGPGEYPLLSIMGVDAIKEGLCRPVYSSLPIDDYLSPGLILPYSGSSGCFWNKCSFCPEKAEANQYIPVPAAKAADDLDVLITKTNPVLVHLLDNSISTALMKALMDKPSGAAWYGFARISERLADIDFCVALKRSGCVMLKLGLESGAQGVLDNMQKGIDIETVSSALKTLKRAGIATYVYLLFGTPSETLTEARKTLEFTVRHSKEISFLNIAIFNMPVCGPEAGEFETSRFYEGDLSLYTDFLHPGGWNRKEVRRFLDNEFKKHKAVSGILKNDPPIFTSNHAPFFVMKDA